MTSSNHHRHLTAFDTQESVRTALEPHLHRQYRWENFQMPPRPRPDGRIGKRVTIPRLVRLAQW